jgi:hypothetical protein
VPRALSEPATWDRFDALRQRAERDPDALGTIRAVLDPLERQLWAEAIERSAAGDTPDPSPRLLEALDTLGA